MELQFGKFGFNPENGEEVISFEGPNNPHQALAWDSDREILWVSGITSQNIVGVTRNGEQVASVPRNGLRVYGLACYPDDPDQHPLYVFSSINSQQQIYKLNPDSEDGDTTFVKELVSENEGSPTGAYITNLYDINSWVFISSINDAGDDRIDIWQLATRTEWMVIEPSAGVIPAQETQEFNLRLASLGFPAVMLEGELIFTHDGIGGETSIPITLQIQGDGDGQRELTVPLEENWNMISINVTPPEEMWNLEDGPDVILMTEQLRIDDDNHHLLLMKNEDGMFYLPAFGFNNIPYWDLTEGYLIKVDETIETVWSGEPIPADVDIPLEPGWNLIAYYPNYELDASTPDFYVLSPIIDHVLLAKDGDGNFILPAFNFSNMPPWRETQGYQVKVDEDVVLNYPPAQEQIVVVRNSMTKRSDRSRHFVPNNATGENMSVLISSIQGINATAGSELAAIASDGRMVGTGIINTSSQCGLAVWGDDQSTDEIDGMLPGESFSFKLWDERQNMELTLTPITTLAGAGLVYEPDGLTALEMATEPAIPAEFYLSKNFPNPFNSTTTISFGISEGTNVEINIYDISGRFVESLVNGAVKPGHHKITWSPHEASTGIYIVRCVAGGKKESLKVALIR